MMLADCIGVPRFFGMEPNVAIPRETLLGMRPREAEPRVDYTAEDSQHVQMSTAAAEAVSPTTPRADDGDDVGGDAVTAHLAAPAVAMLPTTVADSTTSTAHAATSHTLAEPLPAATTLRMEKLVAEPTPTAALVDGDGDDVAGCQKAVAGDDGLLGQEAAGGDDDRIRQRRWHLGLAAVAWL